MIQGFELLPSEERLNIWEFFNFEKKGDMVVVYKIMYDVKKLDREKNVSLIKLIENEKQIISDNNEY